MNIPPILQIPFYKNSKVSQQRSFTLSTFFTSIITKRSINKAYKRKGKSE